jgi:hypothetical protein
VFGGERVKEERSVAKRMVFYLGGYDPRGARYYYDLYKREGAKEEGFVTSKRTRTSPHLQQWKSHFENTDDRREVIYHFLEWDDIIRAKWSRSSMGLLRDFLFYLRVYILGGLFLKYLFKSPRQMEGIFFPLNYLLVSLFLLLLVGFGLFGVLEGVMATPLLLSLIALVLLLMAWGLLLWATKVGLFWLLRIFVFSAQYVLKDSTVIDQRMDYFSELLAQKMRHAKANGCDEVVILSHSVGTILAVPLVASLLERLDFEREDLPQLVSMTLGESIPLVSVIPQSIPYQQQMQRVANDAHIRWIDYTTPIDLATFPLLNFFEDVGIKIAYPKHFYFLSPRFHRLYSPKRYKKIKKDHYKAHFLYLLSHERSEGYNFFRLIAGERAIEEEIARV